MSLLLADMRMSKLGNGPPKQLINQVSLYKRDIENLWIQHEHAFNSGHRSVSYIKEIFDPGYFDQQKSMWSTETATVLKLIWNS